MRFLVRRAAAATAVRVTLVLAMSLAAVAGTALAGCGDSSDALVGTWRQAQADPEGIVSRYTFFADGRAQIVVRPPVGSAQTFTARYRVEADTLLTLRDAQGEERFAAHVAGDTLALRSPLTGQRTVLVRVSG